MTSPSHSAEGLAPQTTLALSTKVEEDFVAPLTAVRGALELIRDFPDMEEERRQRFAETALESCAHLERAIQQLAASVYAAGQRAAGEGKAVEAEERPSAYAPRIRVRAEEGLIEIDFSDFEFSSSNGVNEFYDEIEKTVSAHGGQWYFLVNHSNCSVWPEAWVAFAHRGKKINVTCSLGTVRYVDEASQDSTGSSGGAAGATSFASRDLALAEIKRLKSLA